MSHPTPSDDRPAKNVSEKKPVSEKKLAANRANAQKSTGPRTAEGKARAAMNAVLHDQTMRLATAPGESASQFAVFAKLIRADLRPQNFVQTLLVERAVDLLWKIRRAQSAQLEFFATEVGEVRECVEEDKKLGKPTEEWEPLLRPGCVLLRAVEEHRRQRGAYLRLDLYADRLQRALTSVLLRLRQDQERTGPGSPPRDREFRIPALARELRRAWHGCLNEDAESLSEPTGGPTVEAPSVTPTPDAVGCCDETGGAAGEEAKKSDRENEPTGPGPVASFEGSADPSLN